MTQNWTHGYDLVFELNEEVINNLLRSLNPEPFSPQSGRISEPLPGGGWIEGDYEVYFPIDLTRNVVEFDTSIPDGVSIASLFSINIVNPDTSPPLDISINGQFRIRHNIEVYNHLGQRCLGIDFSTLPHDRIEVDMTEAIGLPVPVPPDVIEAILEELLYSYLQNTVGSLPVFSCNLPPNSDPLIPDDFDVRIINDDCAAILITTTPETHGDRDAFTESHIPPTANSALIISSYTLLHHILCPYILDFLGIEGSVENYFDYSNGQVELNNPTSLTHLVDHVLIDTITLETMRISVGEDSLSTEALVIVRGFGYRASAQLSAQANIQIDDDGDILINYDFSVVDVDIFIYPAVYILIALGIAVVPAIGGIGAIVLLILPFVIDPIAEYFASHLTVGGTLTVPPLPIEIDAIILDDLQFIGRAITPERGRLPEPSLWLESEIEVTGITPSGFEDREICGAVLETRVTFLRSHRALYLAETMRMRYPIRYEWWLDSHALIGEATVNIGGTIVSYDVRGNRCELVLDEGESLTAELLVRATASDDLDLLADKYIEVKGSTEIRSFHGVELLEGPQVLELLQTMEFPTPIEETTSMMYLDEVRIVARRLESEWRSRRSLFAEQRSALLQGMGFDFQIEDFR